MAKEAYMVWAFGEDNTYSYCYRDLVGVFTNFRAMFKALRKDGMTRQQIADFHKQNPYNKFTNINIDYEEGRDSSSYCFEAITLNEHKHLH